MGLLDGKRLLITGVITDASLAFHAAKIAQEQGAQVVLTGFGRHAAGRADRAAAARARRPSSSSTCPTRGSWTAWSSGCRAPRRRSRPRRGAALDRLRARLVPGRRRVPEGAVGGRGDDDPGQRVLVQVAGTALLPLLGRGSSIVGHGLRQPAGLARLRLDGRGEVHARVGHPVPRPRPRAAGDPGQPGRGRAGARRWPPSRSPASPRSRTRGTGGRRWAGTSTTRCRWPRRCARCSRTGCRSPPARWSWADGGFHCCSGVVTRCWSSRSAARRGPRTCGRSWRTSPAGGGCRRSGSTPSRSTTSTSAG